MNEKEWNEKEKNRKWATDEDELLNKEDLVFELEEIINFAKEHPKYDMGKMLLVIREHLENFPKTDKKGNIVKE